MGIFNSELESALAYYKMLLRKYNNIVQSSPPGKLMVQTKGNWNQILHVEQRDGKRLRHGINQNTELQHMLAQKAFAEKAVMILQNNIDELQHALNRQLPFDPDEIIRSMGKAYALLPNEYFFNTKSLAAEINI